MLDLQIGPLDLEPLDLRTGYLGHGSSSDSDESVHLGYRPWNGQDCCARGYRYRNFAGGFDCVTAWSCCARWSSGSLRLAATGRWGYGFWSFEERRGRAYWYRGPREWYAPSPRRRAPTRRQPPCSCVRRNEIWKPASVGQRSVSSPMGTTSAGIAAARK